MLDTGVNAAPVSQDIHPRILERVKRVGWAKRQEVLLAQLDRLIDSLGCMSLNAGRFAVQANTTRKLRDQLVSVELVSSDNLVLLNQIKQHMANLVADFAAFDPNTESDGQP